MQRLIAVGLELIVAGLIAALYTEWNDTGRGYEPNPIFWRAFISTHISFLLAIPLFANGRTLGMLLTNLTATSNNGKIPNFFQIILRAVFGFGPVILTNGLWYFVSIITGLIDKKGRGWGEFVSYTTVKRKDQNFD
ncbi:RDD family protein [Halobacillus mangrovi]|uniref:RDD family protein n=1 Tax=Halobacillus mangrovi TaxID=402384 RepID=UPI0018DBBC80|nr:RDD family protein [Halobacillus mangrovi]